MNVTGICSSLINPRLGISRTKSEMGEKEITMRQLNRGKRWMVRTGRFPLAMSAAAVLMLVTGLSGIALGASTSVETVTYTPHTFNFEVHPQGGFIGGNNVSFTVSRKEDPHGITQRCKKVKWLWVVHDPNPVYGRQHPGDYILGTKELAPPLCSFTNVVVTGKPFREEDVNSVCFETPMRPIPAGPPVFLPGKSSVLDKEVTIAFQQDPTKPQLNKGIPRKQIILRANIQCVDNTIAGGTVESHGQDDILPQGGSTGTAVGTVAGVTGRTGFDGRQFTPIDPRTGRRTTAGGGGAVNTGGAARCDLTGTWAGYSNGTRSTGWKFEEIFKTNGAVTYRATHLSNQGIPTNSNDGAIIQNSSGNYLFHTLLTKIPGVNGSYQEIGRASCRERV